MRNTDQTEMTSNTKPQKRKYIKRNQPSMSSKHPLYGCWRSMLDRTTNPGSQAWPAYGGRGIKCCQAWRESFAKFVADMGDKPSAGHYLDRIDNDGNYTPKNCRWCLPSQSARNRRSSVKVMTNNGVMVLADAAEAKGINRETAYARTARGLAPSHALIVDKGVRRTMALKHDNPVLRLKTIKQCAADAGVPYVALIKLMNAGAAMDAAITELRGNKQRKADRKTVLADRASGVLIEKVEHGEQVKAARALGLTPAAITLRIKRGMTREQAMTTPKRGKVTR
jgi:hypothetical protein